MVNEYTVIHQQDEIVIEPNSFGGITMISKDAFGEESIICFQVEDCDKVISAIRCIQALFVAGGK